MAGIPGLQWLLNEEFVERIASLEVVEQVVERNSCSDENQLATHDFRIAVIDQVRTLRSRLPAAVALTTKQRRAIRTGVGNAEPIVQASLNVIGVSENVSAAVGHPIDTVRELQQDAILWKAAEEEVRNLLAGIAGANAIRRQKLAQLGSKAYVIGSQLAREPENEVLVPHVEEIKRMKRQARRKKTAPDMPQPSPSPSTPAPTAPHAETKQ